MSAVIRAKAFKITYLQSQNQNRDESHEMMTCTAYLVDGLILSKRRLHFLSHRTFNTSE